MRRFAEECARRGTPFSLFLPQDFLAEAAKSPRLFDDAAFLLRGEIPPQVYDALEKAEAERAHGFSYTPHRRAKLLADDKKLMYGFFAQNGFRFAPTLFCEDLPAAESPAQSFAFLSERLGSPFVAKPRFGSQGRGVALIRSAEELEKSAHAAKSELLFQKYIHTEASLDGGAEKRPPCARDLRLFVCGDRVLCAAERTGASGKSFLTNAHAGSTMRLAGEATVRALAQTATSAIARAGLLYGSADFLPPRDGGEPLLCEINASPGFEALETQTGARIAEPLLDFLLQPDFAGKR